MQFNSLIYCLLLPALFLLFYYTRNRFRWMVLLAASISFYAAQNVPYLLGVLGVVATGTYCCGIWLDRADAPGTRRMLLWVGIAANILTLAVMKYLPFLAHNVNIISRLLSLDGHIHPVKSFIAIGVSYYVFQAIAYLVDVYRKTVRPERHIGYFLLYFAFFPKILQGPIERAGRLLPQLKAKYELNYDNISAGLLLFAWGLLKKSVIADRLAVYVDTVYGNVHAFTGLPLLLSSYAYTFQIYMDFSGYTDMALGTALLFNIKLMQNFNSPYLATSVADFWRRWHMSLTTWLRDYLYFPLGGSRVPEYKLVRNLLIVFLLSGLWHGASWVFVLWGGLHGLYLVCAHFYRPYQLKGQAALGIDSGSRYLRIWRVFVTFQLVNFAWIFFRAENFSDAFYVATHMWSGLEGLQSKFLLSQEWEQHAATLFALFAYMVFAPLSAKARQNEKILAAWSQSPFFRYACYGAIVFFILVFHATETASFIYIRF